MQIDKEAALRHLESFGLPWGGQGAGTLKYWRTLDGYLADYTLTWDEIPNSKLTWENGAKKRGYNFARSYRRPDPRPNGGGVDYPEEDPPQTHRPFWRRLFMTQPNEGPAPATFPADEATQELWDGNKKLTFAEELDALRRSRAHYDRGMEQLLSQSQQLFSANYQMLTNTINNAQRTEARANRHDDLAATQQWRDQAHDDFPNSQVSEGDVGEGPD